MTARVAEAMTWACLVAIAAALWAMFLVALLHPDQDLGVPAHVIDTRP